MRVSMPRRYLPPIRDFLDYLMAKKVSEGEESTIFEVCFSFQLSMENLDIRTHKEWKEFCWALKVDGGRKSVFRGKVSLTVSPSKIVKFKISDGEFQLARELLKKTKYPSVSAYLRGKIEEEMLQNRKEIKKAEAVEYG